MGLEVATYIDDLVISNPSGTDDRSQGDDHIRLIKSVLKNTFPNITGPVTLTQDQINAVLGNLVPVGVINMWSGAVANIPSGWKLCNGVGTISNGSPVPNLVDRFIVGSVTNSGGNYNIGDTGGSKDITISGNTGGTALTIDQIPSHNHAPSPLGGVPWGLITTGNSGGSIDGGVAGGPSLGPMASIGGGQTHNHTISITNTGGRLPPYYALAFIIKD